jgi:3-deoxy-manno-octulosonate cytidylyltransferase (CMP-KDO synthetase)
MRNDVAIVIPARTGSKRFPNKTLVDIGGLPMVIRVATIASEVLAKKHIYIVTPDEGIRFVAQNYGFQCIVDDREASSGTEKMAQCVDQIREYNLIHIHGDEPTITPESIEKVIKAKLDNRSNVLQGYYLVDKCNLTPTTVTMVTDEDEYVLYISRHPIPYNGSIFKKTCGIFGYDKLRIECFEREKRTPLEEIENIEQLRFLEDGWPMIGVQVGLTQPVDVPEDLEKVKSILGV